MTIAKDNHHILIHHEKQLILFLTPKCGNSSIKDSILKGCDTPGLGYEKEAGFFFAAPNDFTEELIAAYTTVVITRDPVARIISAWSNKILNPTEPFIKRQWPDGMYVGMGFEQFVDRLVQTPHEYHNMHTRSIVAELISCGYNSVDCTYDNFHSFQMESIFEHSLSDVHHVLCVLMETHGIFMPDLFPHINASDANVEPFIADISVYDKIEDYYGNDMLLHVSGEFIQ